MLLAWLASNIAGAQETTLHTATLADLFPASEVASLSKTLPADREVKFRARAPSGAPATGVIVFISPGDSGELPAGWAAVLDAKHLQWIAADGFGNSRPTAERMLVAVMALKLAARIQLMDANRHYIAGMSGGGRVASQVITHFPQLFAGAIFIVGADYSMPGDPAMRELLATRRMVFITGSRDFNHREMKSTHTRYQKARVANLLMIDQPGHGHELATPEQLTAAIEFLEAR
jgi:poly(3-hydroxybutyrate) depolymerase